MLTVRFTKNLSTGANCWRRPQDCIEQPWKAAIQFLPPQCIDVLRFFRSHPDNAGFPQYSEVMRHGGLGHGQTKSAARTLAMGSQLFNYAEPYWIAQRIQDAC